MPRTVDYSVGNHSLRDRVRGRCQEGLGDLFDYASKLKQGLGGVLEVFIVRLEIRLELCLIIFLD